MTHSMFVSEMKFEIMDFDRAMCECETKEFFGKYGYKVSYAEFDE